MEKEIHFQLIYRACRTQPISICAILRVEMDVIALQDIGACEAHRCDAHGAPRYENVSIILQMRGLKQACTAPLYEIEIDHDWDETAWSKLRAFLYYVKL